MGANQLSRPALQRNPNGLVPKHDFLIKLAVQCEHPLFLKRPRLAQLYLSCAGEAENIPTVWETLLTTLAACGIIFFIQLYIKKERIKMTRIQTLETKDLKKSLENGGCGECQTSCQSACKTSCGVANQQCENCGGNK